MKDKGHDSVKSTVEESHQKLAMAEQSQLDGKTGRNESKWSPREREDLELANSFAIGGGSDQMCGKHYCGLNDFPQQVDYLNAIIQLLYHNELFRHYVHESLSQGVVHSSISQLFNRMEMVTLTSAHNVHSTLLKLKPQFHKDAKYEAQQLFVALVELMQQEANQPTNVQNVTALENKSADQAWDYYSECVNNSRLATLMMSQVVTTQSCLTCRHQSHSWSVSCLVQVNIPEKANIYRSSLNHCLDDMFAEQTLKADCVKCQKVQKSSKRSFINRFPPLLVFHLPRISSGFDVNQTVIINECIKLEGRQYHLTSALLVNKVLYVADCWTLVRESAQKWTSLLNDLVNEIPLCDAKQQLDSFGYLLMYSYVPKTAKSESKDAEDTKEDTLMLPFEYDELSYEDIQDAVGDDGEDGLWSTADEQDTNTDTNQQWADKPFGYCGLENHNLTCYANSCLQLLFTLEKVRKSIIENSKCGHFNQELSSLFANMQIEANKPITFYSACVSPVKFIEKFCSAKPQFRINQMADAQEFLAILLETIHQEANIAKKLSHTEKQVDPKSANEAWNYHLQHVDHSYLSDMFMGQIECSLSCCVCKHTSLSWCFIWQLQVHIPNTQDKAQQKAFTLMDCINDYTDTEILNKDSDPFCSECQSRQPATKGTSICRAPLYLMVHLKRFAPDGSKICVPVVIDERLNLAGQEYGLLSVVLHAGNESTHGHNFAMHREGDNQWILLDDKSVNKGLSNSYAKNKLQDNAYVCTYLAIAPNETSDKAAKQ